MMASCHPERSEGSAFGSRRSEEQILVPLKKTKVVSADARTIDSSSRSATRARVPSRSSAVQAPDEDSRLARVRRGARPVGSCAAAEEEPSRASARTRVTKHHGRPTSTRLLRRAMSGAETGAPRAFRWFVGIDWGTAEHAVYVTEAAGTFVAERKVPHTSVGLADFVDWLTAMTGAGLEPVAVAIEKPHGAVVELLVERGAAVFAVNPKQLD